MTAIATRTRPYTSPYPVTELQEGAIAKRDEQFAERNRVIKAMMDQSYEDEPDPIQYAMIYDFDQAPDVTSRQRLLEHGIIPVPPQELVEPVSMHDELWTIIEAMSLTGIYLMNTGHLTDSDLYARLYYRILDEPTRLMPPSSEAAEFIDCLHPMDLDHPLGQMMTRREPEIHPTPTAKAYKRGPKCTVPYTLNERDEHLPRPSWQS